MIDIALMLLVFIGTPGASVIATKRATGRYFRD
jgi:hypothetical protein